ncbi:MAG: PqqD family protein [Phycisphaerales bacterium]|nr:PqqD family protein [Phycisphaerales bacterium]
MDASPGPSNAAGSPRGLSARSRLRHARPAILRELDGEAVLYDPAAHEAIYLNAAAMDIWRAADGAADVESVVVHRAASSGVDIEECRADVVHVVDAMTRHGWLKWEASAAK